MNALPPLDPKLDLEFTRIIDVAPEQVWAAWTKPEHIVHWFTPAPWKTVSAEVDLRPGGRFFSVMQSPEGEKFPNTGCYLELIANRRLVWTNGLLPGFRPPVPPSQPSPGDFPFTAIVEMAPHGTDGTQTRYTARAIHADEKTAAQHAAMGFEPGWGAALDQLVAYMKKQG